MIGGIKLSNQLSIVVWSKDGCSYCNEVKSYLTEQNYPFKVVDVTQNDAFRDILEVKYGVRHVPVVEIGTNNQYVGVVEVGLEHVQKAIGEQLHFIADV